MVPTIYRIPATLKARGTCRATLYNDIRAGLWCAPVKLGPRSVGWPESEVAALNQARIAGLSDEQIRALVRKLEAARSKLPEAVGA